ncbi:MAG: PmoA family protein [Pirellulaceae bacterium]|mgnify:FL=1|nr:PmoA family protein [Pirellulaceae bacterium]
MIRIVFWCFLLSSMAISSYGEQIPPFKFDWGSEKLSITVGGKPFADYCYEVPRAGFINVFSPAGIKVTRNYPPQQGDDIDHPHHSGIFLTFGDLNGIDFWHIHGKVLQDEVIDEGKVGVSGHGFSVKKRFLANDEQSTLLSEACRFTLRVVTDGYLLEYDSTFTCEAERVVIGSKEEGGLGVRVATPMTVKYGGKMKDDTGRQGGTQIWGKQANWVEHSANVDGMHVGLTMMVHPDNFSNCWWHARDYGVNAANPFGPLNDRDKRTRMQRGDRLRMRYAILVHSHENARQYDAAVAYERYIKGD